MDQFRRTNSLRHLLHLMILRRIISLQYTAASLALLLLLVTGCESEAEMTASTAGAADAESIFNGKDLSEWKGDERFWSVEDGAIVGQTTVDNPTETNTFLIWNGGPVDDFELTFDFRIDGGNSGLQYRSENVRDWVVTGYQADLDAKGKWTGGLYEEKGRGVLAEPGQKVVVDSTGIPTVEASIVDRDSLRDQLSMQDWNTYAVIAENNRLVHKINGVTTVDVTDNDTERRSEEGILAFQVHRGAPMRVEFMNVMLKRLPSSSSGAR